MTTSHNTFPFASLFAVALLLTGCGVTQPTYTPPEESAIESTSVTVDAEFDEAWSTLIDYASQRFFAIDSFEKDSGLLTLTFSSDPSRFIDCGMYETDGPSYEGTYIGYAERYLNGALSGRMNLTVREAGAQTEIAVNTRYVFEAGNQAQQFTWTFNTGGSDTQVVPSNNFGATQERTCRPTHEAEEEILEGIQSEI